MPNSALIIPPPHLQNDHLATLCKTAQAASHEPILTLLPGLHGTGQLYQKLRLHLQLSGHRVELIELPQSGPQDYPSLLINLEERYDWGTPRILIAESFSGPLAINLAAKYPDTITALVLAATFCSSPKSKLLALLPIRPLFMLPPLGMALRYFLLGDEANTTDLCALARVTKSISSKTINQRLCSVLCLQEAECHSLPHLPILILQAQYDHLISWGAQNKLEQHYPHAEIHWIPGPHLILQQAANLCHPMIDSFLANLKPNLTHT